MREKSLTREIVAALAFKLLALTLLYFAFFSNSHRILVTPSEMAAFLRGDSKSTPASLQRRI